jgi:hypothetical protein
MFWDSFSVPTSQEEFLVQQPVFIAIIIIIIIIIIITTFVLCNYNYIPVTNRVSTLHSVAAIL